MQNATWLVTREVTEAAGPWDETLQYDQDGEYFTRVLLVSEGTRFVPETGIFYRVSPTNRISYLGNSNVKRYSLFRSMKLHIHYLRSLEESERVRKACLAYLQNWYQQFYPQLPDIVAELHAMAAELGGRLVAPSLNWKYAWIEPILGWKTARWLQHTLPELKGSLLRQYDRAMFKLQGGRVAGNAPA
jgi:hypothetical protein